MAASPGKSKAKPKYACPACGKSCASKRALAQHAESCAPDLSELALSELASEPFVMWGRQVPVFLHLEFCEELRLALLNSPKTKDSPALQDFVRMLTPAA